MLASSRTRTVIELAEQTLSELILRWSTAFFLASTRSEPLYPKRLEGSVVCSRVSGTNDRHPADRCRVIKP